MKRPRDDISDLELIKAFHAPAVSLTQHALKRKRIYCVNDHPINPNNKALTNSLDISAAATALAKLPRNRRRPWSGWIHGKHMRRDDLVVVSDGQVRRIYGAVRGQVIVLKDPTPETGLPAEIFPATDLKLYKNPHAVLLGSLKRDSKEARSDKKRKACRINASKPPRAGSRARGRPRKRPENNQVVSSLRPLSDDSNVYIC